MASTSTEGRSDRPQFVIVERENMDKWLGAIMNIALISGST